MKGKVARQLLLVVALVLVLLQAMVPTPVQAGTQCYSGTAKGLVYSNGEWHHYVEFLVNISLSDGYWYIKSSPVSSSLWPGYYSHLRGSGPAVYKEVGYRWPSNWWDPYSASSWVICHR
jgi:hypothetical protein